MLAVRPDVSSPADALFTGTVERWGKRLTPDVVHHIVEQYVREHGWYRAGTGAAENVTSHYQALLHTYLRDRTGDRGIVKYLHGDVTSDVIDTYIHDWGDRVRNTCLEHIYVLTTAERVGGDH